MKKRLKAFAEWRAAIIFCNWLTVLNRRDTEGALLLTDKLYNTSVDMQRLLSELTSHFRDLMIIKTVKGDNKPIVCSEARLKALTEQAAAFDIKDIMHALTLLQASAAGYAEAATAAAKWKWR